MPNDSTFAAMKEIEINMVVNVPDSGLPTLEPEKPTLHTIVPR